MSTTLPLFQKYPGKSRLVWVLKEMHDQGMNDLVKIFSLTLFSLPRYSYLSVPTPLGSPIKLSLPLSA